MLRALFLCSIVLCPLTACAKPPATGIMTAAYGPDRLQVGDLRLPKGKGPFPVAVVIHGGCWTSGVATRDSTAALADALTKRGIATWNIEYRVIGDSGGSWPGTLQDWSVGTDKLRDLANTYPLDLGRVIVMGHSAGGHAALWVAARSHIPAGELKTTDPLPVEAAVSLDGPGDLQPVLGYEPHLCGDAAGQLLDGTAGEQPERFKAASPDQLLPIGVPQYLVSAVFVPMDAARRYQALAKSKGDTVTIIDQSTSGHFEMITPGTREEAEVEALVVRLLKPTM